MRMIIHDLSDTDFSTLEIMSDGNDIIISNDGAINKCMGCFGCWIKTPGICVIKDNYQDMGSRISKCSSIVIISKCTFGCYSLFVKNVLDRSIPYLLPYFDRRNHETHHKMRYNNPLTLSVHFYGDISSKGQSTAKALVQANSINLNTPNVTTRFYKSINEMKGVIK